MTSVLKSQDTTELLESAKERGVWNASYLLLSNLDPLMSKLGLTDVGRLSSIDSHNHARLVEDKKGNKLVLKLISQNTSLETECLREWARNRNTAGFVPKLIDYGEITNGGKWNLQEFIEGESSNEEAQYTFSERNKDYERMGVTLAKEAFKLAAQIRSNDFNREIFPDEVDVLSVVLEREFETKNKNLSRLVEKLITSKEYLTPDRMFLIHGDFHVGNIFITPEGPKVIDPFGMKGTKASDAAKYIALSMRDEKIKDYALMAEDITECNRIDLGWLIASNIVARLHYLKLMGKPSKNEKGHIALANSALEIW
jgi:Ser/Thr protein kinase RdoA (MazF antagonist)